MGFEIAVDDCLFFLYNEDGVYFMLMSPLTLVTWILQHYSTDADRAKCSV
jgi:hypothetical protein